MAPVLTPELYSSGEHVTGSSDRRGEAMYDVATQQTGEEETSRADQEG